MAVSKATLLATLRKARHTADTRYGITVEKQTTAESGYAATYVVKQNSTQKGVKINIPKDFLVKSATLETSTAQNYEAVGTSAEGKKYIDFVVNTVDNDGADSHIYLPVEDLVDVYLNGNGLALSNNTFSIQIDSTNAHGLAVGSDGLSLALVVASTSGVGGSAGAMSAADKEKLDGIAAGANAYTHPTLSGGAALTGVETADATPAFGGTVSISQVGTDTAGHVTSLTTRTITIPNATAVASTSGAGGAAGLMSAADKEILNSLNANANETISDEEIAAIFADE